MRVSFLCTGLMVFLVAVVSSPPAAAAKGCYHGRGHIIKKMARGFEIQISRYPDKDNPELDECEAEIYDPRGDVIFSEHDWGFSIGVAGYDVNGDGIPDVVLEAYSGGAHCCWTFYVISLGSKPGLITKFENNHDAAFFWNKENRRIEIATRDGNFDYFDGLCHACTPLPLVYLRLDGRTLLDISSQYLTEYDEMIAENRKALTTDELRRLRDLKTNPSDAAGPDGTVAKALMIVLAYLYSGREAQAREALHSMWPPFDQERMWKLIQETRRDGVLCYTRKEAGCGPDVTK